jgi:hypothetical protein
VNKLITKNMRSLVRSLMRWIPIMIIVVVSMYLLGSCTENRRAKTWGGTMRVELEKGQKLVHVTWKDSGLWYLTESMEEGYVPKTKTFQENSRFGVIEGKVLFIESK